MTVTPDDLVLALNDTSLNVPRAQQMIDRAVLLCSTVVDPLPDAGDVVVERVAIRGYLQTSARQAQLAMADSAFGAAPGPVGGIYLTRADEADLRRASGSGGAFTVSVLPADYVLPAASFDAALGWDNPNTGAGW